jgi:hypothetical protein
VWGYTRPQKTTYSQHCTHNMGHLVQIQAAAGHTPAAATVQMAKAAAGTTAATATLLPSMLPSALQQLLAFGARNHPVWYPHRTLTHRMAPRIPAAGHPSNCMGAGSVPHPARTQLQRINIISTFGTPDRRCTHHASITLHVWKSLCPLSYTCFPPQTVAARQP